MAWWWLSLFIILLLIEAFTINLVTIWFAIGCVASLITSMFTDSILIQMIVFISVSFVSLLITKPIVRKLKSFSVVPTNSDRVIGKVGEVIKPISKNQNGEIKFYGNVWTASSDEKIDVGERAKVISIEGVKLIVKKEED